MSAKKKQEEKHLQALKAMQQMECNKRCFECDQRGPTYVDITIGSFVCTSCGGVLRGLNPPHRVKSVSMATFSPAEISFMESRGNELCRKIFLGKYDAKSRPRPDSKDHAKLKFFMEQKYEQKRWYVAPDQALKLSEVAKQADENVVKTEVSKPLTMLLGNNTPKLRVDKPTNQPNSTNILADFSSPPAATSAVASSQSAGDGFADFNSAFSSQSFDAFGDFTSGTTSKAATTAAAASGFANFSNFLTPVSSAAEQQQPSTGNTKTADKYADLGDLFSSDSLNSSSTGMWSGGLSTGVSSAGSSVFGMGNQSQGSVFGSNQQSSIFGSNQNSGVFGNAGASQHQPSVFAPQQSPVFGGTSQPNTMKPQNQTSGFGMQQQTTNMFGHTTQLSSSPFAYTQPSNTTQSAGYSYLQQPVSQQPGSSPFHFTQQPSNTSSSQFSTASTSFGNQNSGFISQPQQPFMSASPTTMANPFMQSSQQVVAAPANNTGNPFMMQQSSQLANPTNPFMNNSKANLANTANPFF